MDNFTKIQRISKNTLLLHEDKPNPPIVIKVYIIDREQFTNSWTPTTKVYELRNCSDHREQFFEKAPKKGLLISSEENYWNNFK